ncbi:MAG: alpha/beta fold hydrolase [Patescibacteria group bacterium]|nr:alpha/beta fold hydrolase [Patescibacteria group bacterium]
MKRIRTILVRSLLICIFLGGYISVSIGSETSKLIGQHVYTIKAKVPKTINRKYLLFLPENYGKEEKRWPLILYLHGASVRGDNINRIKKYGLPWKVEQEKDFPFIVVSPQCPRGKFWMDTDALITLLNEVKSEYNVDPDRIYVTGVSMGGQGAWYLAAQYPDRFAAVATMCGRADPDWATSLKDIPVWVFHGEKDRKCPIRYSENMVNALEAIGGMVKFTVYPKAGHNIVTETYNNNELYEWLLQHRRQENQNSH